MGMKCPIFYNLSMTTKMESFLFLLLGRPVIKSILITSHFHSGMGNGCSNPEGCWCLDLSTLALQCQPLTWARKSVSWPHISSSDIPSALSRVPYEILWGCWTECPLHMEHTIYPWILVVWIHPPCIPFIFGTTGPLGPSWGFSHRTVQHCSSF